MVLEGFMHLDIRLISLLYFEHCTTDQDINLLVEIMSLRDIDSWKTISTFLRKYSFFVKTFIVWALIITAWDISSIWMLKLVRSDNGTQGGLNKFLFDNKI